MIRQLSVARPVKASRASQAVVPELLSIDVVLDPASLTLTVAPFEEILGDGNDLVWRFFYLKDGSPEPGLPPGWAPNIFFVEGPKDSSPGRPPLYTGPLSSLRASPRGVLGRGSSGLPGTYIYRALALNGASQGGGIIASSDHLLTSSVSERTKVPEISVGVDLLRQQFEVLPLGVRLYPEETLIWNFVDLPSGFQPAVRFKSTQTESLPMELFFGPFESLCTDDKVVTGLGRSGSSGRFEYSILLVDEAGNELELLGSPDPHIDTEPDPFEIPVDPGRSATV